MENDGHFLWREKISHFDWQKKDILYRTFQGTEIALKGKIKVTQPAWQNKTKTQTKTHILFKYNHGIQYYILYHL